MGRHHLPLPAVDRLTPGADAKPTPPPPRKGVGGGRAALAVLAPAGAALAALLVHELAPNRQDGIVTGLYALLLQGVLLAALLIACAQCIWRPLRPWARHYGPLVAGAMVALEFLDAITLKLNWLPLPYFPGPDAVLQALAGDYRLIFESAGYSLRMLVTGYLSGVALGLVCGVLMGWFRNVRYWGMPVMKIVGPIPATALVPLAMVFFNDPLFSGASLIALAVWFPVTMLTMSGIANVPVAYFDVARTLGAGRAFLIFRVAIPAALPTIFIGVFMGLLTALLTLMVAETVGVKAGLGWYISWQKGYAEYDKVYAALVIMSAFFSGIMTLLFKLRDWVLVWQKGMIRW
jgi:NitT/TauT family transport system permease protein